MTEKKRLVSRYYGMPLEDFRAVVGAIGGASKSKKKVEAARRNAKLGGRPPGARNKSPGLPPWDNAVRYRHRFGTQEVNALHRVIYRNRLKGMSYEEIATRAGLSKSTVQGVVSKLARLLRALQEN